jgi:hypothetical protein
VTSGSFSAQAESDAYSAHAHVCRSPGAPSCSYQVVSSGESHRKSQLATLPGTLPLTDIWHSSISISISISIRPASRTLDHLVKPSYLLPALALSATSPCPSMPAPGQQQPAAILLAPQHTPMRPAPLTDTLRSTRSQKRVPHTVHLTRLRLSACSPLSIHIHPALSCPCAHTAISAVAQSAPPR